jgi:hypothetical protein
VGTRAECSPGPSAATQRLVGIRRSHRRGRPGPKADPIPARTNERDAPGMGYAADVDAASWKCCGADQTSRRDGRRRGPFPPMTRLAPGGALPELDPSYCG